MTAIEWVYNDGGRADAGYKGHTGDCVVRAFAIASGEPYKAVYDYANLLFKTMSKDGGKTSNARTGVFKPDTRKLASALGFEWTPTMGIGTGCRVHLRSDELPSGMIVAKLSKHVTAVVDGVLHDTWDCSRDGTRCVYGYWR